MTIILFRTNETNCRRAYNLLGFYINLLFLIRQGVMLVDNAGELKIKFRLLWDVAPSSQVEVYRRFRGAYCVHHHPDDGSNTHL
jgi:hypothetical protein